VADPINDEGETMAKPAPQKMVQGVAIRGVRVEGRAVHRGESFECSETDLALMRAAHQAVPADSEEATVARSITGARRSELPPGLPARDGGGGKADKAKAD
jgi:hypothetical protein